MLRGLSMPLAACGVIGWGTVVAFKGVDVTGQGYDGEFRLLGHDGKARTRTDFPGKVVVITFGFTRCPDVCPTSLATLAAAADALGEDRKRVQGVFITVDPERDTPALLAKYVTAFEPTFLGLPGDLAATRRPARGSKLFYPKPPLSNAHSTISPT